MSTGISTEIYEHFEDQDSIVDYYSRNFSRPEINRFAEVMGVEINGRRKEEDTLKLLEEGAIEIFHEYYAKLYGIGTDTIREGVRKLDRARLSDLSDEEMESKVSLVIYFIVWEWDTEIELIQSLRDFRNKTTYERLSIDGTPKYAELSENVKEDIEDAIREVLPSVNETQRYKSDLHRVEILESRTILVRLYSESRSSSYRQFTFRGGGDASFPGTGKTEVGTHTYWPLRSDHIYVDYERNEYYAEVKRNSDILVGAVIDSLYDGATYGENIEFVDPLDFENTTPEEFIQMRVDKQREVIERTDNLEEDKKEDYFAILEDLESAEQTRIRLEHVNVEGNLESFEIGTEEDISEFLEAYGLEDRVDEFNEKSRDREYTIRIGNREIDVTGTRIRIRGDISEDEELIITSLLRRDGAIV